MAAIGKIKTKRRIRRHLRLRKRVVGTPARPRLAVFRSINHIYAQLIDDVAGRTLCTAATVQTSVVDAGAPTGNKAAAEKVGEAIARRAIEKGLKTVVFDRGGFIYHGRVRALADAARKTGLVF